MEFKKIKYHTTLAAYFRKKADPRSDGSWRNLSPHALVELPFQLANSGEPAECELTELLTDTLYLNARTSVCDIWQLLDDYSNVNCDADGDAGLYRAFIAKHAQTLSRHEGQLVALLHHEGFPLAKTKVNLAQRKGLYTNTWLRTEKQYEQQCNGIDAHVKIMEIVSCWEFRPSSVVGLAAKKKFAFHLIRLGVIGIVDMEKACPLDQIITIREVRPLALFSSDDGRHLAVAYESGEADILDLDWSSRGLAKQNIVTTLKYQLPQFEAPAMCWNGHCLIYQKDDGDITSLDIFSGEQLYLIAPLDTNFRGELRSVATLNNDLILAMSSAAGTQLLFLANEHSRQICQIENSDVVSVCTCGASRVAVAFTNREVRVFSIAGNANELARATIKDMPICMAYDNGSLILATDVDTFYIWRFDESGSPTLLNSHQTNIVSRFARHIAFSDEETLLSVSQSTAVVLRITLGNDRSLRTILALFETSRHSYAVIKREKNVLLVKMGSENEIKLAEDTSRFMKFCMDGSDNFLYACSDGTGFVLNCISEFRCQVSAIPLSIAAVAGDPNGGFWIADRLGDIHRVETDGSVQQAWSSKSNTTEYKNFFVRIPYLYGVVGSLSRTNLVKDVLILFYSLKLNMAGICGRSDGVYFASRKVLLKPLLTTLLSIQLSSYLAIAEVNEGE